LFACLAPFVRELRRKNGSERSICSRIAQTTQFARQLRRILATRPPNPFPAHYSDGKSAQTLTSYLLELVFGAFVHACVRGRALVLLELVWLCWHRPLLCSHMYVAHTRVWRPQLRAAAKQRAFSRYKQIGGTFHLLPPTALSSLAIHPTDVSECVTVIVRISLTSGKVLSCRAERSIIQDVTTFTYSQADQILASGGR